MSFVRRRREKNVTTFTENDNHNQMNSGKLIRRCSRRDGIILTACREQLTYRFPLKALLNIYLTLPFHGLASQNFKRLHVCTSKQEEHREHNVWRLQLPASASALWRYVWRGNADKLLEDVPGEHLQSHVRNCWYRTCHTDSHSTSNPKETACTRFSSWHLR